MSAVPRQIPTTLFGLPPLGALVKSTFFRAQQRNAESKPARPAAASWAANVGGTWPTATAAGEERLDMNRLLAAAKVAPDLAPIEWDGDRGRATAGTTDKGCAASPEPVDDAAPLDAHRLDPRRRKIRERYVSARFPGVARTLADLQSCDRVIKAARLYFEDEQPQLALELLELAAQEAPHESPLWLARLEILFLVRDAEAFVQAARAFREAHPQHDAWPEVERLGRALVPGEALFGETSGPRDHEHYGPWPHLPNWIQAPWDLTADIAAGDFRRAALRLNGRVPHSA